MNSKILIYFLILLLVPVTLAAQSEWQTFDTLNSGLPSNQVHEVKIDMLNNKWFATANGLASFDDFTWKVYDTTNSGIPSSFVNDIEIDDEGILWIGTDKGLARFDGNSWNVYDTSNSILESQNITDIVYGNYILWVGTEDGLAKYEGNNWEILNDSNSGLFEDQVHSLILDKSNNLWIGVFEDFSFRGFLIKYDGTDWEYYNLANRELPSSFPDALAVDNENNIWLGTKGTTGGALVIIDDTNWSKYDRNNSNFPGGGISSLAVQDSIIWTASSNGLLAFSEGEWEIFNTENSGIPDNVLLTNTIDKLGNKWVGTIASGAAVFNKGGIITSIKNEENLAKEFELYQNYPNPFNPVTNFEFRLPAGKAGVSDFGFVTLKIFDVNGKEAAVLVNEEKAPGIYKVNYNAGNLSSGIYFYQLRAGEFIQTRKMMLLK